MAEPTTQSPNDVPFMSISAQSGNIIPENDIVAGILERLLTLSSD